MHNAHAVRWRILIIIGDWKASPLVESNSIGDNMRNVKCIYVDIAKGHLYIYEIVKERTSNQLQSSLCVFLSLSDRFRPNKKCIALPINTKHSGIEHACQECTDEKTF